MTDFRTEKPSPARVYCPGCEPCADPFLEILDVRWCDDHAPARAGLDDVLATARGMTDAGAEAGGEDNRRWCQLIHREAAPSGSGARGPRAPRS